MKKTYSQLNLTEATQAINALQTAFKRVDVRIQDFQLLRLAQLNFDPESNEIKMLLNRDITVSDLFEQIDKLAECEPSDFDGYNNHREQRQQIAAENFKNRTYG